MYKVKSLVIILVDLALMVMVPSISGSGQQAKGSTNGQPGKNGIQDRTSSALGGAGGTGNTPNFDFSLNGNGANGGTALQSSQANGGAGGNSNFFNHDTSSNGNGGQAGTAINGAVANGGNGGSNNRNSHGSSQVGNGGSGEWRSTEPMRLEVVVGLIMQLSVMKQVLIQSLSWATEEMEVLLRVRFLVLRVEMAVIIVLQPGL